MRFLMKKYLLATLLTGAMISANLHADMGDGRLYVGAEVGYSFMGYTNTGNVPDNLGSNSGDELSAVLGYVTPQWRLYTMYQNAHVEDGNLELLGIGGDYFFMSGALKPFVGAQILSGTMSSNGASDENNIITGLSLGVNYTLSSHWSVDAGYRNFFTSFMLDFPEGSYKATSLNNLYVAVNYAF
jgi:opacity protein-like surface antigen